MAGHTYLKLFLTAVIFFTVVSISAETAVEKHGWLQAKDGYLLNEHNQIVQLRGMSYYWSTPAWNGAKYYDTKTLDALVDSWKCTVVRVAYDRNGSNDNGWDKCKTVIDHAIKRGIYVIIDWHSHTAEQQQSAAVSFFKEQAINYKNTPNVIFEPYNEPITADGSKDGGIEMGIKTWGKIKPYLTAVTKTIRDQGSKNLVIVGTPYYAQHVQIASSDPIPYENVAYAFHFYAASHGPNAKYVQETGVGGMESSYLSAALGKITIFATEWGTTHSDGSQQMDAANTQWWFDNYINNKYHISWCNWSVSDFEGSSAFTSGGPSSPSASGQLVKKLLTSPTTDTYDLPSVAGNPGPAGNTEIKMPGTNPAWNYNSYWGAYIKKASVKYSQRDKGDVRTAANSVLQVTPGSEDNWISYTINNSQATKNIIMRYLATGGSGSVTIYVDKNTTPVATVKISKAPDWTSILTSAAVPSGKHDLKFTFPTTADSGYGIEWIELTNETGIVATLNNRQSKTYNTELAISTRGGQLSFTVPTLHDYNSFSLISVDGRIIQHGVIEPYTRSVNINGISNGMWFLKINRTNGTTLNKTIVTNN